MGSKSPPAPPDPAKTAEEQIRINQRAIEDSSRYNQIGQQNPWGSVSWEGEIGGPDRRQIVTLDPQDRAALDARRGINAGLLGIGRRLLPHIGARFGSQLDFSGLPAVPGQGGLLGAAQPLEQATYRRGMNLLRPQFDEARSNLETSLANRGIAMGSEAYDDALDRLDRAQGGQLENLALSSVGAGRQEQSRLFDLGMQGRRQGISEMLTQRSQPYNELTALLGGTPTPNNPNFQPFQQYQMQAPDLMGATMNQYAIQAQNAAQNQAGFMNGLFGLGSAGLALLSDRRFKTDIRRVGRLENGLAVYAYRFRGGTATEIGLMADEVETLHPAAVREVAGVKLVDYGRAVVR